MNKMKNVGYLLSISIQALVILYFLFLDTTVVFSKEKSLQAPKEVDVLLGAGDKYVRDKEFDLALAQYRRALAHEPNNTAVINKIVETLRDKIIPFKEGFDAMGKYQSQFSDNTEELTEALDYIYNAQSIAPALIHEPSWVLNEAYIQRARDRSDLAIKALERALLRDPKDPDLLAELGKLQLLESPEGLTQGIEFIIQAEKAKPKRKQFCFYLGTAYARKEDYVSALRIYYDCAKLPIEKNELSKEFHLQTAMAISNIFNALQIKYKPDGVLAKEFRIPISERLKILEYAEMQFPVSENNPKLMVLYLNQGEESKAAELLHQVAGTAIRQGQNLRNNPDDFRFFSKKSVYVQQLDRLAEQLPDSLIIKALQYSSYKPKVFGDPAKILAPLEAQVFFGFRVQSSQRGKNNLVEELGPVIGGIVGCGLAANAGLEENDIIESINGVDTPTLLKFFAEAKKIDLDKPVEFKLKRQNNQRIYQTIVLTAKPKKQYLNSPRAWFGFRIQQNNCATANNYSLKSISVDKIYPDSPIAKSKVLSEHSFYFEIDNVNGKETQERYMQCAILTFKPGDRVKILAYRKWGDKNPERLIFTLGQRPNDPILGDCDI